MVTKNCGNCMMWDAQGFGERHPCRAFHFDDMDGMLHDDHRTRREDGTRCPRFFAIDVEESANG